MTCLNLVENIGPYSGQLGQLTSTQSGGLTVSFDLQGKLFNKAMIKLI